MPLVTDALYSGGTQAEKDRLAEAITEDVVRTLKVPKTAVIVVFRKQLTGTGLALVFAFSQIFLTRKI
jgi:4-oxalocrotonate tautomerase